MSGAARGVQHGARDRYRPERRSAEENGRAPEHRGRQRQRRKCSGPRTREKAIAVAARRRRRVPRGPRGKKTQTERNEKFDFSQHRRDIVFKNENRSALSRRYVIYSYVLNGRGAYDRAARRRGGGAVEYPKMFWWKTFSRKTFQQKKVF